MKRTYYLYVVLSLLLLVSCNTGQNNNNNDFIDSQSNSGRDTWQKPELVIDQLGDIDSLTIVDVGAGTGYFTFRIAFRAKKVIAIEIDPKMVELIELFKENLPLSLKDKVEARLVTPDNPMLSPGEADLAVIINTIGYIENQSEYLSTIRNSLPSHGRIVIVDYKKKFIPIEAPKMEERVSSTEVEKFLSDAGFKNIKVNLTSLEYQYIIKADK